MAPNANLINLMVLDQNGQSSDSIVIAAIDQAIALKSTYNIRLINLSLGRAVTESYKADPLCQAVEAAWKAGIVVVVAAGNDGRDNSVGEQGYGTIDAPGNDPYVITVGAMKAMDTYSRTDDLIASYSSKGPSLYDNVVKPDLVAPGNQVVSVEAAGNNTLFNNYPNNAERGRFFPQARRKDNLRSSRQRPCRPDAGRRLPE
jgi:serine protease AprX